MIDDIEKRLSKNEWNYLIDKYPQVAFNYKHFNGTLNSKKNGYKILYTGEPYITMPEQWTYDVLKQYEGIITFNTKFYHEHKHHLNIKIVQGCIACNSYYEMSSWKSYDERENAACILNKSYGTGNIGDIVWLRPEISSNLDFPVHIWAQEKWGGNSYKGKVNTPIHHSHISQLEKIGDYRFCICFESSYHSYWSWDFITERMFNCFKAKTIPIYIGCYNIEDHVPNDLFIDFRQFYSPKKRDYFALSKLLNNFPKSKWVDMTERAYEWNKTNRIGNVEDIENTIKEFGII